MMARKTKKRRRKTFYGHKLIPVGSDEKKPRIKTFDEPGRGRKLCKNCGKYVGLRTKICLCCWSFEKKKVVSMIKPPKDVTMTPAGAPPVKLKKTTKKAIRQWMIDVHGHFGGKMKFSATAYKYYVRYFFEYDSEKYKKCVRMINAIEKEKQSFVSGSKGENL